jgi:predicted phage terminase large subunit-like protein
VDPSLLPVAAQAMRDQILRRISELRHAADLERTRRDADAIRARCSTLRGFVAEAWHILEPEARYVPGWHIDAICEHLEAISRGQITRLLINVPPGSMKSLLASVCWQAFEWGPLNRPALRFLSTSFNDGPVKRDTRKTRDLILSDWYQTLWPHVQLTRTGETSFANSMTGTREGIAFGSLTSQRGDRLGIDDPHSTDTAESEIERGNTTRRFREGAQNRLNDQEKSAILVIMQRLHMDDISGIIEQYAMDFDRLIIPMEFDPARRIHTKIGWTDPRKQEGELMCPARWSAETIAKLQRDIGDYAFAGQYQQRPAPREGGMFPVDKITVVDAVPPGGADLRGWDIAGSTRKTSPFTAGVRIKVLPNRDVYVLDVARGRLKINAAEDLIVETATNDGLFVKQSIPQDPGSAGLSQKNQLAGRLAGLQFHITPETGTKEDRAIPIASQVQAGKVYMMRGPWNSAFVEELRNFPTGSFKDQVDAFSRAYNDIIGVKSQRLGLAGPKVA